MKHLFLVLITLNLSGFAFAQSLSVVPSKPSIDTSLLTTWEIDNKWPKISDGALSGDGKYLSYVIREYLPIQRVSTVLQKPDGKWKRELIGVSGIKFSIDSRSAFYLRNDTFYNIKLGTTRETKIEGVQSYNLIPYSKGEWLVYQLKAPVNQLIVQDEKTKKEHRFKAVENYSFSKNDETVVLESKNDDEKENRLTWVDLTTGKEDTVWTGTAKLLQKIIDDSGRQLAFITEDSGIRTIWQYQTGKSSAIQLIKDGDPKIDKGLFIGGLTNFSKDGERLFFSLEKRESPQKTHLQAVNVTVWSTKDLKLQSTQQSDIRGKTRIVTTYLSLIDLKNEKIIKLQQDFEKIIDKSDDFTLVFHLDTDQDVGVIEGETWNPVYQTSVYYLISNRDGGRRQLPIKYWVFSRPKFSPNGKFIIYTEKGTLNYFSYETATSIVQNITTKVNADLTKDDCYKNVPTDYQYLVSIPGWLKNDEAVLIYDRNDIWLVDPLAKKSPENLTNGYGKKYGIIFRLLKRNFVYESGQKLILSAFNKRTKVNGHFSKVIGEKGDPVKINMELAIYAISPRSGANGGDIDDIIDPIKAQNSSSYLVTRETVSDFPNYYFTKDLKHFQQITFLNPEKKYNWITSELHTWVAPDGDTLQGILYKPENFDSSKKYPVLFSIYRQFSDQLNSYLRPFWSDRLSIPYYVSNGYLMFVPDIHYDIPNLKESVLNCVVSGAKHVRKLSFVDSTKMGIQGHSTGGLEIGYVVTGTNIFAAVSSAAGSFDLVSDEGTILPGGGARQGNVSNTMLYKSLWENRYLYINNSSIFDADKITIPFLIVAGEKDNTKPYDQNIEMFLAMRRLGKKAWMLSYEKEYHTIDTYPEDLYDYRIRLTQFFDHYLKEAPAPKWMTKGISAKRKGVESGYTLDPVDTCGKDCKICKQWNVRMKIDSIGTEKEIQERWNK